MKGLLTKRPMVKSDVSAFMHLLDDIGDYPGLFDLVRPLVAAVMIAGEEPGQLNFIYSSLPFSYFDTERQTTAAFALYLHIVIENPVPQPFLEDAVFPLHLNEETAINYRREELFDNPESHVHLLPFLVYPRAAEYTTTDDWLAFMKDVREDVVNIANIPINDDFIKPLLTGGDVSNFVLAIPGLLGCPMSEIGKGDYHRFFQGADRTFKWSAKLADVIKKTLKGQGMPIKELQIPGIAAPISSLYRLSLGMENHVMREAGILDHRALYTFNDWLEKQQAIGETKAVGNPIGEYTQYILDTHVLMQRSMTERRALAIQQGDPKKIIEHLTQEGSKLITDRAAWRKAEEEQLEPVMDPVTEVLVEPRPNNDGIVLGATVSYHTIDGQRPLYALINVHGKGRLFAKLAQWDWVNYGDILEFTVPDVAETIYPEVVDATFVPGIHPIRACRVCGRLLGFMGNAPEECHKDEPLTTTQDGSGPNGWPDNGKIHAPRKRQVVSAIPKKETVFCPCSSGLQEWECCGGTLSDHLMNIESVDSEAQRLWLAASSVREYRDRFISEDPIGYILSDFIELAGEPWTKLGADDEDFTIAAWSCFDIPLPPDGRTIADRFLDVLTRSPVYRDFPERDQIIPLIRALSKSYQSFYKVVAITQEKIDLREITTGGILSIARVVEEVDVAIEDEGGILWARIIGSDENNREALFTNPLVFMKTSFVSSIEKNLDENYNRYCHVNEEEEDAASRYSKSSFLYWLEGIANQKLLKIYPAMRDLPWVQQAIAAGKSFVIRNSDFEARTPTFVSFRILDWRGVQKRFKDSDDIDYEDPQTDFIEKMLREKGLAQDRTAHWSIVDCRGDPPVKSSIATIRREGEFIVSETDSMNRGIQIRDKLTELLAGIAEFQGIESKNLLDMPWDEDKVSLNQKRNDAAMKELFPDIEEMAREELREFAEAWPLTPLPYLDDLTPEQAVRTPLGRERVEWLINRMESMHRNRPAGTISFHDFPALRRRLGLPPASGHRGVLRPLEKEAKTRRSNVSIKLMKYHPSRYYHRLAFALTSEELKTIALGAGNFHSLPEYLAPSMTEGWIEKSVRRTYDIFHDYERHGNNIFEFRPILVEMFGHTEVQDLPMVYLTFPHDSMYIHFGPTQLAVDRRYLIDGAYVQHIAGVDDVTVSICFTTCEKDMDYWTSNDPVEFLFSDVTHTVSLNFNKTMDPKNSAVKGLIGQAMSGSGQVEDAYLRQESDRWSSVLPRALRLVINSLCYIATKAREIALRYPDTAPQALVDKLERSKTPKEIERNGNKLATLGFSKIFYCGDDLQKQTAQHSLNGGDGRSGLAMPHHYRAGHWTQQVWGPALSLRKLIWLMPIEVNRGKNVPKRAGHVYFVD